MNQIFGVNMVQTIENILGDIKALIDLKKAIFLERLCRIDITFITILHNQKDPPLI